MYIVRQPTFRVVSIQMMPRKEKALNLEYAEARIREAKGADLIVLPELWNIGFSRFDRYLADAEDRTGPTLTLLQNLATEVGVYIHSGSLVEREGDLLFNSSYLISPSGELIANYRKIHLFGYRSRESHLLSPGDQVEVVETSLGTIAMATCYDLRFPELFRCMVDLGAEIFLICSAWPYPRLEHWLMLNRVRALENQAFLVSANCVGTCAGVRFVGHSMIVDPWGVIVTSGGDEETVLCADLDLGQIRKARGEFPALADRVDWLNQGRATRCR